MQVFEGGDFWEECDSPQLGVGWIVIPTNIGWKKDGTNPMGRGLAQAAAIRYPWLPALYGEYCRLHEPHAPVTFDMRSRMVLFPTKPMNEQEPGRSWKGPSSLDLIRQSAKELNALLLPHKDQVWPMAKPLQTNHVLIPTVGCGSGTLDEDHVVPVLHEELDDRHTLFLEKLF